MLNVPNTRETNRLIFLYLLGLLAVAILSTVSHSAMQWVVAEQRHYTALVKLAGQQSGMVSRIAFFASVMATTDDHAEFASAKSEVGLSINMLKRADRILRYDSPDRDMPRVMNANLRTIYEAPSVNLNTALKRYLERANAVYNSNMRELHPDSIDYIYLANYGPHALEPIFDAVAQEYDNMARTATRNIENLGFVAWIAVLVTLGVEVVVCVRGRYRCIRESRGALEGIVSGSTSNP